MRGILAALTITVASAAVGTWAALTMPAGSAALVLGLTVLGLALLAEGILER